MSVPVGELNHVKIRPSAVRSVEACIGIVLKPIAHSKALVERDTDAYGCNNLERSSEVLPSKVMRTEQGSSKSYIDCIPSILTAEGKNGDKRTDEPGCPCFLNHPGTGDQPRAHSPA